MITKFKIFENDNYSIITDDEYNEYLDDLKSNTGWDNERAKWDLDYYLETIENLQKNGGLIYRLVWLFKEEDLNTDSLGEHWNINGDFDNFYASLESSEADEDGNESKSFLIIAKTKSNNIRIDDSLSYYIELPTELEVNINEDPTEYKLIPFERHTDYSHIKI